MKNSGFALVDLVPRESINVSICHLKSAQLSKGAKSLLRFASENWQKVEKE
jgi:hypothetical protein